MPARGSRLNKVLAACGICSRRDADALIAAGRVAVNGQCVTKLGTLANPDKDRITLDGKPLLTRRLEYVAVHKPKGVITTCEDERNRYCVVDLLPEHLKHLKPVGRLDRESAGLLIMTNDGELIQALTHPTHGVGKKYRVTVAGQVSQAQLKKLASGIELDLVKTKPCQVNLLSQAPSESTFAMVLSEGRNRQIRRMCNQVGLRVLHLVRVAIGELQLSGLKPGGWRALSRAEINHLRKSGAKEG